MPQAQQKVCYQGAMEHGQTPDKPGLGIVGDANPNVAVVMQRAEQELRQLIKDRSEVTKRIGTVKRTIRGLAKVFGDDILDAVLLNLVSHKKGSRRSGITAACRRVLMEAVRPMTPREVCDEIQRVAPSLLAHHKDPMATINTILARLVKYGEARVLRGPHGQRVWLWMANGDSRPTHEAAQNVSDQAI